MRIGSLFTGYGGLDMAAEAFFNARTVWTCDVDPGAAKILARRYPDAPNFGDITAVDWATVQPVDILAGGWPCQPFSLAGKRKGADDERALWPEVARAVRALRPRHVVLENVAAITTVGELARAVGDLAALGYVGQWRCLRASDIGAPHQRARLFIVATDSEHDGFARTAERRSIIARTAERATGCGSFNSEQSAREDYGNTTDTEGDTGRLSNRNSHSATDAERVGESGRRELRDLGGATPGGIGEGLQRQRDRDAAPADTNDHGLSRLRGQQTLGRDADRCCGSDTAWGAYEPAIRRWERVLGRATPAPTEPGRTGGRRLSPRFVEWMMGLPDGWVTDVPGLTRNAQLKALGNGVVPQQALAALQLMGGPR
jgi:DNA (cytosine-5)-methyltransferase 1